MSRVIGIDLGSHRVGIAASDPGRILASPHSVLARGASHADDHRHIADLVSELSASHVVVGLPRSLDGKEGPAARMVRAEIEELRAMLEVPVDAWDERLSTVTANRGLQARGVKSKAARKIIDQEAAAVILQSWLDAHG
ncbi:MAG: Holliday junction resolvase RuvX [Acidobacteria bacterium]|nr:Holliday junction resolvase RuvX [Acidobacteriota bacterium]